MKSIIAENTGSFDRCRELGLDLVRCTTMPDCCPYCKKYEDKVYSVSGNDKRFPALYETALQKGYNIMHPNCRHEFIPFVEELETKESLEKIIKDSNHFEDLDKNDKIFKVYNQNQALHRQWVDESREFHRLQDTLGDKMPYKTLGSFRRARRSNSEEYQYTKRYGKDLTNSKDYSIIKTGARVKTRETQDEHAVKYYGLVRKMTTDVDAIAKNTGFSKKEIQSIKNYIFIDKHDFADTPDKRFPTDFDMAQSWQRLFEGKNILPHDITLIKHELLEIYYLNKGFSQEESHVLSNQKFNYGKELKEYVRSKNVDNKT